MKPNLTRLVTTLLLALALSLTALPGQAQSDTVTISAAEFQRMVYSGALLTSFFDKPELDASLRVLLELQPRNPHADPVALASVLTDALQRYRNNAPAYIRTSGWQDEMLAAYLDALRQVPKPPNFVPANLTLLDRFMLHPGNLATGSTPSELIHSSNQRLFAYRDDLAQRQELVDTATRRAWANPAFANAMGCRPPTWWRLRRASATASR